MLEINKRYIRTADNGDQVVVIIKTTEELAYHNDLVGKGFRYGEVKPANDPGANVCLSCEG